jgi:hypothetical protein
MKKLEKPMWQQRHERKRKSRLTLIGFSLLVPLVFGLFFAFKNITYSENITVERGKIVVKEGGDFQAALNRSKPGDTIYLQAGATFTGNFTLPKKEGDEFITIRTSAPDKDLPLPGVRLEPKTHAAVLPKLVTPNGDPVINTAAGAHHYRFTGVEFSVAKPEIDVWKLIYIGDDVQNQIEQVPYDIAFDRCYVHAHSQQTGRVRSGLSINGRNIEIVNSYISDFRLPNDEGHAIVAWNAPGPFRILNNYIEAAGINVLFGGATAHAGMNPANLEFRRNHVTKNPQWRDKYAVKNLFELKDMRRALIEENIFENNWASAQNGTAILFTPSSHQSGPGTLVEDIVFRSNIVRRTAHAIAMTGTDYADDKYPNLPVQNRNVRIENNLFTDIGGKWGDKGGGRFLILTSGAGPDNLVFNHNTIRNDGTLIMLDGAPIKNFVFTNNVGAHNEYGVIGVGERGGGMGTTALEAYTNGFAFKRNLIFGANSARYPAENFYPPFITDLSNFSGKSTDGKDIGCDLGALSEMEKNVIAGD